MHTESQPPFVRLNNKLAFGLSLRCGSKTHTSQAKLLRIYLSTTLSMAKGKVASLSKVGGSETSKPSSAVESAGPAPKAVWGKGSAASIVAAEPQPRLKVATASSPSVGSASGVGKIEASVLVHYDGCHKRVKVPSFFCQNNLVLPICFRRLVLVGRQA